MPRNSSPSDWPEHVRKQIAPQLAEQAAAAIAKIKCRACGDKGTVITEDGGAECPAKCRASQLLFGAPTRGGVGASAKRVNPSNPWPVPPGAKVTWSQGIGTADTVEPEAGAQLPGIEDCFPSPDLTIPLPWPPSVNHYWRHVGAKILISKPGRQYRIRVRTLTAGVSTIQGPVRIDVAAHAPDRRRRDLDNLTKSLFDSLQAAGVLVDDCQVKDFRIRWAGIAAPLGGVTVRIWRIAGEEVDR